jgi:cytochrome d ubiquinol oxidase subunit I
VLVYGVVFSLGIYYINRLIAKGPEERVEHPEGFGHRPLAAGAGGDEAMQAEG